MRIRIKMLILLGIASVFAGCDVDDWGNFGDSHAYEKPFHYAYDLKPGGRLDLENFNGSVEIAGWDRDRVEIDGVQYGSTPQLRDAIKIDIAASADLVRIQTVRPPERHGGTGVKYVIKAPRKLDLDHVNSTNGSLKVDNIEGRIRLRTSNGSVRTARIRGTLDVATSNGSVDVEDLDGPATVRTTNGRVTAGGIRGALEATSSNGSIHARIEAPENHRAVRLQTTNGGIDLVMVAMADNDIRASTNNGGITVKLPSGANAHVRARTSHSLVHTDFDVRGRVSWKKNELDGEIGSGGPAVELTSSNGSIRILKF